MGLIAREGTAPIQDGEVGSAADVELEFAKLFTLVNGNLNTANVSPTAGLLGTQLANSTVTGAKIATDTVAKTNVAANALTQVGFATADNTGNMTSSTSLVDVDGLSAVTLTPGSTSDIVVVDLVVTYRVANAIYIWGVNISGVGDVLFGVTYPSATTPSTFMLKHVTTAAAATSTVYTARYKNLTTVGSWDISAGVDSNTLMNVTIYPVK